MMVPPPVMFSTMKFWLNFFDRIGDHARCLVGRAAGRIGAHDRDHATPILLRHSRRGESKQADGGQSRSDNALQHRILQGVVLC
jgi:hypothetical protein